MTTLHQVPTDFLDLLAALRYAREDAQALRRSRDAWRAIVYLLAVALAGAAAMLFTWRLQ